MFVVQRVHQAPVSVPWGVCRVHAFWNPIGLQPEDTQLVCEDECSVPIHLQGALKMSEQVLLALSLSLSFSLAHSLTHSLSLPRSRSVLSPYVSRSSSLSFSPSPTSFSFGHSPFLFFSLFLYRSLFLSISFSAVEQVLLALSLSLSLFLIRSLTHSLTHSLTLYLSLGLSICPLSLCGRRTPGSTSRSVVVAPFGVQTMGK